MFINRKQAALLLAKALEKYKGKNVLVLGIPRGGAETAYYIARCLDAELSLLIVKKLSYPRDPECAFGAIAEDGTVYYNPHSKIDLSQEMIDTIEDGKLEEIERSIQLLRKGYPFPDIRNKTVIIVDDGIATGSTVFAAIKMCRKKQASGIVVAAPVASQSKEKELLEEADEVVILEKPAMFLAVSQAYQSFDNLTDQQTVAFLEKWQEEKV